MKIHNILFGGIIATGVMFCSCTDRLQFGNSFISKAPGAGATADTVFNSAEYTEQYLTGLYSLQYYGLPWRSSNSQPQSANYWNGQMESLSDCYHLFFSGSNVYGAYYSDQFTGNSKAVYGYNTENIWTLVHGCYNLIENVDRVPGLSDDDKNQMKAEAKCLVASVYFNMFRFYGGLPLVTRTYDVNETEINIERSSVESTVNYIVNLLDEASNVLPWNLGDDAQSETGRWTKAGAMALKCKVLCYAASPLFNDNRPYYSDTYSYDADSLVWYGNYNAERWTRCLKACEEFFAALNSNGYYELVQPLSNDAAAYRYAYRYAYINEYSPEIIHSTRVTSSTSDSKYSWYSLSSAGNNRYAYCPTQEYAEMFPWADGTPFDWDETEAEGMLDKMFVSGDTVKGQQMLQNRVYTRDPRMYEVMMVNGAEKTVDWSSGKLSGANFEIWVGGTDLLKGSDASNVYASGYRNKKHVLDAVAKSTLYRKAQQWPVLRLADLYLIYAEAIVQSGGNNSDAIALVDKIRARVGMKGLAECNPDKNLESNDENLLEEIMRERACELGFEDTRLFDMLRYKRKDRFETTLHGLRIYRLVKDDSGNWVREESQWYNADRKNYSKKEDTDPDRYYEPSHFDYEKFEITFGARKWWDGFDVKWFLHPFPTSEVNKGYLRQNPGWN